MLYENSKGALFLLVQTWQLEYYSTRIKRIPKSDPNLENDPYWEFKGLVQSFLLKSSNK